MKFQSLGDFEAHLDSIKHKRARFLNLSITKSIDNTNGWTFDQTISALKKGAVWPEGARDLARVDLPTPPTPLKPRKLCTTNVAGFSPNVPNYLNGVPDSMFSVESRQIEQRVIKIGVNVGRYCFCDPTVVFNRGRAVLEVINELETIGYSVELWSVWRNEGISNRDIKASCDVCIKQTNEPVNLNVLAFCFCSYFYQRRLVWHCIERSDNARICTKAQAYGSGERADYSDFDIALPYVNNYEELNFLTPETARDHLINLFNSAQ